jgi:hypothetical protein
MPSKLVQQAGGCLIVHQHHEVRGGLEAEPILDAQAVKNMAIRGRRHLRILGRTTVADCQLHLGDLPTAQRCPRA